MKDIILLSLSVIIVFVSFFFVLIPGLIKNYKQIKKDETINSMLRAQEDQNEK